MTYYKRVECPYRGCPDCGYEGCKWCFEFEKVTEELMSRAKWEATIDYEAAATQLQSAEIDPHGTWLGWAKIIVDAAVKGET